MSQRDPLVTWAGRVCALGFSVFLFFGLISAYRAWVQIRSVELVTPASVNSNSRIEARVVSWARTYVTVRIILDQSGRSDTLGKLVIGQRKTPSLDPRPITDTLRVVVADSVMRKLIAGPATVRAIATGGPQWLRTPPPVMRSVAVEVGREH